MATHEINHQTRIRWIVVFIVLLISTFFCLIAFRFVSFPFLIAAWVFFLKFRRNRIRPALIAWTVWLMLTFAPIDGLTFCPFRREDVRGLFRWLWACLPAKLYNAQSEAK
jgi:hypothetical protein